MISLNGTSLPGFRGPESVSGNTADSSPHGQSLSSLFTGLMTELQKSTEKALPGLNTIGTSTPENPLGEMEAEAAGDATPEHMLNALKELAQTLESGTPGDLTSEQQALLRQLTGDSLGNLNLNPEMYALLSRLADFVSRNPQVQALMSAPEDGPRPAVNGGMPQATLARSAATDGEPLSSTLLAESRGSLPPARSSGSPAAELLNLLAAQSSHRDNPARQLQSAVGAGDLRIDAPGMAGAKPIATEWAPVKVETSHSQWARDLVASLGDRLTMQINQQVKEATVRVDPPELGKVELIVRMDGDRLNIQLNASNAGVRDMLTQHAERLRNDLLAQNLQTVDVHVGQDGQREQHKPFLTPDIVAANPDVEDTENQTSAEASGEKRWLSTSA
jgi:flagellar hook-length control protein FliK